MTETWETKTPDLVADVRLYRTDEGGKAGAALHGYGCPLFPSKERGVAGWDARMQLGDEPFEPGTMRRVGFVFLSPESADAAKRARHFLWEGKFVGEARVVD